MCDEREQIASSNPDSEPSHHCPLCKRTFAQESTRKRHYYYCRSKLSDTNTSRRRSCAACVRAKTRCIWPTDGSLEACARCNERGTKCEYDVAARGHRISRQDDSGSTSSAALHGERDSEIQRNTTASTITRRFNRAESLQVRTSAKTNQNIATPLEPSPDGNWDVDLGEIDILGLENKLVGNQDINSISSAVSEVSNVLVTGTSFLAPWTFPLSSPAPFNSRAFTKPSQAPLVSLAMRILRSYPFMILRKGILPPFLSPQLYSWAEKGKDLPQKALINCERLVHMFKSRTEANKNIIWGQIWLEQERILTEYPNFDRWELLASLQALLLYCLLRLQEAPVGHDVFDFSLLSTVNLVFGALVSVGGFCECEVSDDPDLAWRNWIFWESRKRTVLIFQVINILVDTSTTLCYYPVPGFVLIPLPSNATLWNAQNVEGWMTEFELCSKETIIYALSAAGSLTRIQKNDAELQLSIAKWEEWSAEVGDIGTLVMIVGALV